MLFFFSFFFSLSSPNFKIQTKHKKRKQIRSRLTDRQIAEHVDSGSQMSTDHQRKGGGSDRGSDCSAPWAPEVMAAAVQRWPMLKCSSVSSVTAHQLMSCGCAAAAAVWRHRVNWLNLTEGLRPRAVTAQVAWQRSLPRPTDRDHRRGRTTPSFSVLFPTRL